MFKKRDSEPPAVEAVYNRASIPVAPAARFDIEVHCKGRKRIVIPVQQRESIGELVRKIADLEGIPVQLIQLKHEQRVLDHQLHLHDYGIRGNCEMFLSSASTTPLVRKDSTNPPTSPPPSPSPSASRMLFTRAERSVTLPTFTSPSDGGIISTPSDELLRRNLIKGKLSGPRLLPTSDESDGNQTFSKLMLPTTRPQLEQLLLQMPVEPKLRRTSSQISTRSENRTLIGGRQTRVASLEHTQASAKSNEMVSPASPSAPPRLAQDQLRADTPAPPVPVLLHFERIHSHDDGPPSTPAPLLLSADPKKKPHQLSASTDYEIYATEVTSGRIDDLRTTLPRPPTSPVIDSTSTQSSPSDTTSSPAPPPAPQVITVASPASTLRSPIISPRLTALRRFSSEPRPRSLSSPSAKSTSPLSTVVAPPAPPPSTEPVVPSPTPSLDSAVLRRNRAFSGGSSLQVEFDYSPKVLHLKFKREKTGVIIYATLRKKLVELAEVPFYLIAGDVVLPDSDKVQLGSLFGNATERVQFKIQLGSIATFNIRFRDQVWETLSTPHATTLFLYKLVANHFCLAASFYLLCESGAIPCDTVKQIISLFEELPSRIDIEVRDEVVVNLISEESARLMPVPASSTISTLYQLISSQLGTSPSTFYLSPDNRHILPFEFDISIMLFITKTEAPFYMMDAKSTVIVLVFGYNDADPPLPLGFPRDTPIGELWRVMDEYFPEALGFVGELLCTRRQKAYSRTTSLSASDRIPLSALANESGMIEVSVIAREYAIFINILIGDEPPEAVYAHPDLTIRDMFYTILAYEDPNHFTFFGPDNEQMDVSHNDFQETLEQYLDSFYKLTAVPIFRVQPGKQGIEVTPRDWKNTSATTRVESEIGRLKMSAKVEYSDIEADKPKSTDGSGSSQHTTNALTVELLFTSNSSPSLLFYEQKNTPVSSLYVKISRRNSTPITSFLLSHSPGLYLPPMSTMPIHQLTTTSHNSLTLYFVSPKDPSYATLLPNEERNRNTALWRQDFHPSPLSAFPSSSDVLQLNVKEGERLVRINCFEWTDVMIVKDSVSYEILIPAEHQALIFNGRLLEDSERIFDLSPEMKQMREARAREVHGSFRFSKIVSLEVILVTDKSIASAIKFTAQFVKPPVLADAQPEEPPNHFSNATLLFKYLFSLSPALLPEGGTFTSAQIVEFYKDAQNLLIPIIKRLKERQVHMDFNRLMAVYLWTSNILYREVNATIRSERIHESWHHFISHFVSAIKDITPQAGIGYRGCTAMQVFKSYKVGSIVWWKNINSLSKDINQAKRFVGKPGILFEVDYISGRDISPLSRNQKENEILLLPYTHFKVIQIKENANYKIVKLQEVPIPTTLKVIFWVDDKFENNRAYIGEAERKGISVVMSRTTEEALENLERFKWVLNLKDSDFRIVTDMVRKENGKEDHFAGAQLIQEIRRRYNYNYHILIFCKNEHMAIQSCLQRGVKDFYVTSSGKLLKNFLYFDATSTLKSIEVTGALQASQDAWKNFFSVY